MLVFFLIFTAQLGSASASDVVDRVQKFYASLDSVTSKFHETVHNETFGTDQVSDGTVYLKKPGKIRLDYARKSFISNGKTLYVVERDNEQVTTKNLANDVMPVLVTFLSGKGNLKTEFDAKLISSSPDIVIELTPKHPSAQYKTLSLVVDAKQFRVKESIVVDSSNNSTRFQFFAPDFAKSLDPALFEFDKRSVPNYRFINANAP